jgi:CubicO group peptidase (beta-lactamase class C family)
VKKRACIFLKLIRSTILAILIFLSSGFPGLAQEALAAPNSKPAVASSSPSRLGPTDRQELEAFVDQFFAEQMPKLHVPGAVFALVKDGKIFFSKGYGYADVEQKTPVSPDRTLFRVGSVSKLLTATAVMQLAEQGKLNLNDDINKYLKRFHIEKKYERPITFANLLTHTDGFDVAWAIGSATRCQQSDKRAGELSQKDSLEKLLVENLPQRVLPPGEAYLYGDVGLALAGYLVEVISGVPFVQYIDQNILKPLEMGRSSFLQPLPPNLAADLAAGYIYKNGTYLKRPFTCLKSVPTAAFSATATDMAHFMIAHLQGGRYGTKRILKETTLEEMHRQHFTNFPNTPRTAGAAYGFYERFQNNQRAIEHGGSMAGYTSVLSLIPEKNLGFFVAYNDNKLNENLGEDLYKKFLDRYYPAPKEPASTSQPTANFPQQSQQINGSYRYTRYPRYSIVKLAIFLLESKRLFNLQTNSDGTLTLLPQGTKWVEVEPLLFRYPDSDSYMGFQQDAQGRITRMSFSSHVFATYEKLPWYEAPAFQLGLIGFCVLVFLSAWIIWPINPLIQRWRKKTFPLLRVTRLAQFLAGLISVLNIFFLIGMFLAIFQINFWEFAFGMPTVVVALLYLPILTAGLTTGLPIVALLAWRDKRWSVLGRLHYLLITLAASVFIVCLNYWNALGFRF